MSILAIFATRPSGNGRADESEALGPETNLAGKQPLRIPIEFHFGRLRAVRHLHHVGEAFLGDLVVFR
ncbi:hypothetical protein ACFL0I_02070, partial [Gemmatimonadota bacterium]